MLGAGGLGATIAGRLGSQGHQVRLWNRHTGKADDAARDAPGVTAVDAAADAVDGADFVVTVLRDADAVAEVIEPVLDRITGVWVQVSTVGPDGAARLGRLASAHGVAYLDAPVSGSTEPASQGELVWLVAGDPGVVERARPVLDAAGKTVQHVGTGTSEGSALKLAVNAWMTSATVVMAEVLALCDGLDVDHDTLRTALQAGPLDMPYALDKSQSMDDGDHTPGFAVANALKDLRLAADVVPPTSVLREVQARLDRTVDAGHGGDDLAAVGTTP